MRDPDFDAEDAPAEKLPREERRRLLYDVLVVAKGICAACLALAGICLLFSSRRLLCSVCRIERLESIPFGKTWFHDEDNECSLWYRNHVEPFHEHAWMERTQCRRFGIPGIYRGFSCQIGSPLEGLSRRVQVQIYEHFENKLEAKQLFLRLGQGIIGNGSTWTSLMEWLDAGYPGRWKDVPKRPEASLKP